MQRNREARGSFYLGGGRDFNVAQIMFNVAQIVWLQILKK
jgi:hypothetical protein